MLNLKEKRNLAPQRKRVKRQTVQLASGEELVKTSLPIRGSKMPLMIEPKGEGLEMQEWTQGNLDWVKGKLLEHGALLFRGFGLKTDQEFCQYLHSLPYTFMDYYEATAPRDKIADIVYTSTEFPAEEAIFLHNDYSESQQFPRNMWLYCIVAPPEGGETPIADGKKILERLDPEVREKFQKRGWSLVRNFNPGLGISWQNTFLVQTKEELSEYCKKNKIEMKWKSEDCLWTKMIRSATMVHPITKAEVWFNHMAFWHTAALPHNVREEMIQSYGVDGLPFQVFYGDGSPIPDQVVLDIRKIILEEKLKFRWQVGDIIWLDNILTVHGREPFQGPRKIRVAMANAYDRGDFTPAELN